jgi:PBSX family phage terminase large subunit
MSKPPISPKQRDYLTRSNVDVNVCEGSIRSGKTIITLLRWVLFIRRAPRGGELVMVGRTRDSVWRNLIAPLQNPELFGKISDSVIGNYGAPTATILGRKVYLLGASDAKAEKVIRGLTVAGAYVDEITTIPEEFFTQLLGRMSVDGAKLFGSTNPDNPAHWFKTKYLDRIGAELPDWRSWKFGMEDNPSLSEKYKEAKRREFTGLWYRRFILGEWVAAEGAVFDMWDPDTHVIPWEKLPLMRRLISVGIDYGTQHATVAIMLGIGYDRKLYLIDELRLEAQPGYPRLNDAKQSQMIKEWLAQPHLPEEGNWLRPEYIIADQAGASLRTQLFDDGITTQSANKSVAYGLAMMARLFGEGVLFVSDRCKSFITEAPGYSWDPKAALAGEDKPIKVNDDALDAGRYAVVTTEAVWREAMTETNF